MCQSSPQGQHTSTRLWVTCRHASVPAPAVGCKHSHQFSIRHNRNAKTPQPKLNVSKTSIFQIKISLNQIMQSVFFTKTSFIWDDQELLYNHNAKTSIVHEKSNIFICYKLCRALTHEWVWRLLKTTFSHAIYQTERSFFGFDKEHFRPAHIFTLSW